MSGLEQYLSQLMWREVEQFRERAVTESKDAEMETAQPDGLAPLPPARGQDSASVPAAASSAAITDDNDGDNTSQEAQVQQDKDITALLDRHIAALLAAAAADDDDDDNGDNTSQPPDAAAQQQPGGMDALLDAEEAARGFQGEPVRLVSLPSRAASHRRDNGARQQRVYRLAHKLGVAPGAPRWVRGGRPYLQPAVPRCVERRGGVVERNQFVHSDGGAGPAVALRMPGGWVRDLVRNRPEFRGVAVLDGFLWPRFKPGLPRGVLKDWEEQGFVEFNEVRYTTPFTPRGPRPKADEAGKDGVLIEL